MLLKTLWYTHPQVRLKAGVTEKIRLRTGKGTYQYHGDLNNVHILMLPHQTSSKGTS